jgi:hypothetical protein
MQYQKSFASLLEINHCEVEDLPEMLQELMLKAKTNVGSRQLKTTPIDKIKRNIEGLFIQIRNVSIFISTEAGG